MNELIQTDPSRDEMVVYLRKHFRYFTMNSWNRSKSYARNIKIYNLGLTGEQENKAYELLDAQGTFDSISDIIHGFNERHDHQFQIGFNGRSGGYMVLYHGSQRPSGYQSYCTECGQLNYKRVLPPAETREEKLRNYVISHNFWDDHVFPDNSEVLKMGLSSDEILKIVREIKNELRGKGIEYTSDNKCGKCGATARVNFTVPHMQIYSQPGMGMDENADYEEWSDNHLKSRYELIKDFDMAVDDCIQVFKNLVDNYQVIEKEVPCIRKIKVLEPVSAEAI